MEENTIGRVAGIIKGKEPMKTIPSTFKVEKLEKIQDKKTENSISYDTEKDPELLGYDKKGKKIFEEKKGTIVDKNF